MDILQLKNNQTFEETKNTANYNHERISQKNRSGNDKNEELSTENMFHMPKMKGNHRHEKNGRYKKMQIQLIDMKNRISKVKTTLNGNYDRFDMQNKNQLN